MAAGMITGVGVQGALPLEPAAASRTESKDGPGFAGVLGQALEEAHATEAKSEEMSQAFAAGDPQVGLHEVMIAAEKASVSLRYAVTLKNKAIEAYRELMNTPL